MIESAKLVHPVQFQFQQALPVGAGAGFGDIAAYAAISGKLAIFISESRAGPLQSYLPPASLLDRDINAHAGRGGMLQIQFNSNIGAALADDFPWSKP